MLLKIIADQLPYHLGRGQVLGSAEFLERFLLYRVNQDCQSGTFRFHGGRGGQIC